MLKSRRTQVDQNSLRSEALEERKIATANAHLVRYRVDQTTLDNISRKQLYREKFIFILGNIILTLSSISVVSVILILLGHTIHTLPYYFIAGIVMISLTTPYLFSKISINRYMLSYQATLSTICILTCLSSAAAGIYLMKENPQNYEIKKQLVSEITPTDDSATGLLLKPAKARITTSNNQ